MASKSSVFVRTALVGASVLVLGLASATVTVAQEVKTQNIAFDIPAQPLSKALAEFSRQSDVTVIAPSSMTRGKTSRGISGDLPAAEALSVILQETGLGFQDRQSGAYVLVQRVVQTDDVAADSRDEVAEIKTEEIVVTGTNIRGIAPESSPIISFSRDDIEKTGLSSVEQFIEALPQNFGGSISNDTFTVNPRDRDAGGNFSRGTVANLRGLGAGSTLVLLNGRRLAPTNASDFVDISLIPLSAVDRVEILTDGASAIYGSDAIGGVINFILRDDYDGAETVLRYGKATQGSFDEYRASQTLGKSWSSGNAMLAYEYFNQEALKAEERDFTIEAGLSPFFDLLPSIERHSVLATVSQAVTDNVEVFLDGIYTNHTSDFSGMSLGFETRDNADTEQFNLATGTWIDLLNGWLLEFAGSYGHDQTFSSAEFVAFPGPREIDFENTLWTIDAKLDGVLLSTPGGDVRLASGFNYRNEEYSNVGLTPGVAFEIDREVLALYGELFVPIVSSSNAIPGVNRLEFSAALRYEDYNDVGSSSDPKFGLLWEPLEGLRLRGTYSTSFRAPTLGDLDPSFFQVILANVDDPNAPDGRSLLLFLTGQSGTLGPEQSTAWTGGIEIEPPQLSGLKFSVNYYNIDFDDRIDQPAVSFLTPITQPDVFAPVLSFNPSAGDIDGFLNSGAMFADFTPFPGFGPASLPQNAEVLLNNTVQNLAITKTSGIDFSFDYSREFNFGTLSYQLNGNYIFGFEKAITTTAPLVDIVDTIFNPADFRIRTNISWSNGGFSATAYLNHTGGYKNDLQMPVEDIDSWTTVDLSLTYSTEDRFGSALLNNVKLSLAVQNAFDRDPPFVDSNASGFNSLGYDPSNATPLNRFIAVQIGKAF